VIELLPLSVVIYYHLHTLSIAMMGYDVYVRIDVKSFMEAFLGWQRCACYLVDAHLPFIDFLSYPVVAIEVALHMLLLLSMLPQLLLLMT